MMFRFEKRLGGPYGGFVLGFEFAGTVNEVRELVYLLSADESLPIPKELGERLRPIQP